MPAPTPGNRHDPETIASRKMYVPGYLKGPPGFGALQPAAESSGIHSDELKRQEWAAFFSNIQNVTDTKALISWLEYFSPARMPVCDESLEARFALTLRVMEVDLEIAKPYLEEFLFSEHLNNNTATLLCAQMLGTFGAYFSRGPVDRPAQHEWVKNLYERALLLTSPHLVYSCTASSTLLECCFHSIADDIDGVATFRALLDKGLDHFRADPDRGIALIFFSNLLKTLLKIERAIGDSHPKKFEALFSALQAEAQALSLLEPKSIS